VTAPEETSAEVVESLDPRASYSLNTPAWRDEQGRWIDPDSLEPVDYDVPDGAPEGMDGWRVTDLRRFRDEGPAGPAAPYEDPVRKMSREVKAAEFAAYVEAAQRERQAWFDQEMSRPPSNVDYSNRPHFILNVEGREVCGQDGMPWPCEWWTGEVNPTAEQHSAGTVQQEEEPVASDEQVQGVANALGISFADAAALVARTPAAGRPT